MQTRFLVLTACFAALASNPLLAADSPAPLTLAVGTNGQRTLTWPLVPALEQLKLSRGSNVANLNIDLTPAATKSAAGYLWSGSNGAPIQIYGLRVDQLGSNALFTANLLNRIAYGPTPDELARVTAMGPQAYVTEQLAPESNPEPIDNLYVSSPGNGAFYPPTSNGWIRVVVTGTMSSNALYIYLGSAGEAFIDDISLVAGTNADVGTNLIANGDFESSPLTAAWTVESIMAGSFIDPSSAHSGSASLHVEATAAGSGRTTSIHQQLNPQLTNGSVCTLSFWYLPLPSSALLTVRLSGGGINTTRGATAPPKQPSWVFFTHTGPATSSTLYLYLTAAGEAYIDDIKLVAGSVPEAGANLIQNGDFESAFPAPYWTVSPNHTNSVVVTNVSHSGQASLHMVASSAGSTLTSSIYQTNLPITTNLTYTLSYWVLYSSNRTDLISRLSGSTTTTGIYRNSTLSLIAGYLKDLETASAPANSALSELRRWFCLNAIGARRQLFEVLDQFLENHFVTQVSKSSDYLNQFYNNDGGFYEDRYAADFEYREHRNWRNAMLNPTCTFYDLLKISAESPAMIIYLDTVNSKGSGNNIANENYARELLELFTYGVDNGYDQTDIVQMSRAWTGWSVDLVDYPDINNPFAPRSTTTLYPGASINTRSNLAGVWAFNYNDPDHFTNAPIVIFSNKVTEARFGPWAGRNYQLTLPVRRGTNGIQHGYDVLTHLANQPYTMEYISVKLCRLFVHDNFVHGVYDYSNPNALSPEGLLVMQCMQAWDSGNPKGQIRSVLQAIFNSDLFRSHGGSMQKVKTPLEFCISAVRVFRAQNTDGTFTAGSSDGSFTTPFGRMGDMKLFDRGAPDGYPESGPPWISAGTLAERVRYVQSLCIATGQPGHNGGTNDAGSAFCDPAGLIKLKLPSTSWTNAPAVADYLLGIIYPGEGKANLDQYKNLAVTFLNTANDGVTSSPLNVLSMTGTPSPYDTRIRGVAGMLLTLQRFHEQ